MGTDRETIVVALRVPRELLSNPAFVLAFDDAVGYGKAWLEIDMLKELRALARSGKVHANLAALRHFKKWGDRNIDPGKVNHQAAFSDLEQVIKKVGRRR